MRLDRDTAWDEIAGVIEDAYLRVAPTKLIEAAQRDRQPRNRWNKVEKQRLSVSSAEVGQMRQDQQHAYESIMAQLKPAVESWYKGDPFGYMRLCADEVSYYAPGTGGRLDGINALKASYDSLEGKINVPRYEILNPKIQLYGDIGVFTYNLHEYASEGPASYRWNATEVYRRIGDNWRIIHAHWSKTQ